MAPPATAVRVGADGSPAGTAVEVPSAETAAAVADGGRCGAAHRQQRPDQRFGGPVHRTHRSRWWRGERVSSLSRRLRSRPASWSQAAAGRECGDGGSPVAVATVRARQWLSRSEICEHTVDPDPTHPHAHQLRNSGSTPETIAGVLTGDRGGKRPAGTDVAARRLDRGAGLAHRRWCCQRTPAAPVVGHPVVGADPVGAATVTGMFLLRA